MIEWMASDKALYALLACFLGCLFLAVLGHMRSRSLHALEFGGRKLVETDWWEVIALWMRLLVRLTLLALLLSVVLNVVRYARGH